VTPHTVRDLVIWRSVSNKSLCSWRSNNFVSCISVSMKGIFLKLHTTYCTVIWYTRCAFGCDRSLMKDTLPEEQAPSWRCISFRCRDFPNNSHQSLYVNLMKTMCGCLVIIIIKVCYLKGCVIGRLYLGCICRIVTEYSSAITRTFNINSVIVVAISHILSAIYWNSNESSGGNFGCNGGIFLKIHNFHCSHIHT
jgi:cytochrome b subunit of formate dehydrogenase